MARVWRDAYRGAPGRLDTTVTRLAPARTGGTSSWRHRLSTIDGKGTAMGIESLAAALEREHREIDVGIEAYTSGGPADDLVRAIQALRRHIYLEEEFLFPPLRESGLLAPVLVMLREHALMWTTLDELERDLDTGAESARALCRRLVVQLQHHNPKEERVLYPRVDDVLTAPVGQRLRAFLESGELPDGWVCHRARA